MSVIGQLSLLLPYLHADSYTLYSGEKCKHFIAKTGRGRSISAKGSGISAAEVLECLCAIEKICIPNF